MSFDTEIVVIGAGVVGLAVARAFAQSGREVLIIEQEAAIGLHTSSRNSEIIHAGIYYEPNSLKARLCRLGNALLYDYCTNTGDEFKKLGKLIVAQTDVEIAKLHSLHKNALACGVDDLTLLDGKDAMRLRLIFCDMDFSVILRFLFLHSVQTRLAVCYIPSNAYSSTIQLNLS